MRRRHHPPPESTTRFATADDRRAVAQLEVVVLLGLLALTAAATVQSAQQQWELSNRIKCGSDLRQIGQAMCQYGIDDVRGGNFPRTLYDPATAAEPRFATPYEGSEGPASRVTRTGQGSRCCRITCATAFTTYTQRPMVSPAESSGPTRSAPTSPSLPT